MKMIESLTIDLILIQNIKINLSNFNHFSQSYVYCDIEKIIIVSKNLKEVTKLGIMIDPLKRKQKR